MNNIEKYKETKDALEAYNSFDFKRVPFDVWLECEYEAPRAPTLLEAAEAVKNTWNAKAPYGSLSRVATTIGNFADAIDREKRKPVRNCDRFATANEALSAYRQMCRGKSCEKCQYNDGAFDYAGCSFNFLYAEAEKEVSK